MSFGVVYLVRCRINGKPYVGITCGSLRSRWVSHCSESRKRARWLISKAIKKYGEEGFDLTVLEACEDRRALHSAEVKWIGHVNSMTPSGYNMTAGGGGVSGFKRSDEWRLELSRRMKGRIFSEETRTKMSLAKNGIRPPPDQLKKMVDARRGKKRSDEFKRKLSAALKGRVYSPAALRNFREAGIARRGRPLPEPARLAMCRPVVVQGGSYRGVSAAADAVGVSAATISRRIAMGCDGYTEGAPRRSRRGRTEEQIAAMRARVSRPVTIEGVSYSSRTEAAIALGITRQGVSYRIKTGSAGRVRQSA